MFYKLSDSICYCICIFINVKNSENFIVSFQKEIYPFVNQLNRIIRYIKKISHYDENNVFALYNEAKKKEHLLYIYRTYDRLIKSTFELIKSYKNLNDTIEYFITNSESDVGKEIAKTIKSNTEISIEKILEIVKNIYFTLFNELNTDSFFKTIKDEFSDDSYTTFHNPFIRNDTQKMYNIIEKKKVDDTIIGIRNEMNQLKNMCDKKKETQITTLKDKAQNYLKKKSVDNVNILEKSDEEIKNIIVNNFVKQIDCKLNNCTNEINQPFENKKPNSKESSKRSSENGESTSHTDDNNQDKKGQNINEQSNDEDNDETISEMINPDSLEKTLTKQGGSTHEYTHSQSSLDPEVLHSQSKESSRRSSESGEKIAADGDIDLIFDEDENANHTSRSVSRTSSHDDLQSELDSKKDDEISCEIHNDQKEENLIDNAESFITFFVLFDAFKNEINQIDNIDKTIEISYKFKKKGEEIETEDYFDVVQHIIIQKFFTYEMNVIKNEYFDEHVQKLLLNYFRGNTKNVFKIIENNEFKSNNVNEIFFEDLYKFFESRNIETSMETVIKLQRELSKKCKDNYSVTENTIIYAIYLTISFFASIFITFSFPPEEAKFYLYVSSLLIIIVFIMLQYFLLFFN